MEPQEGLAGAGSSTGTNKHGGRHNGTPVLVVSVVLVVSAFAWQMMGAGVLVHMLVLALGIFVGALFHPRPPPADGPAPRATAAETALGRSTHAGTARWGSISVANTGSPAAATDAAAAVADSRNEPLPPTNNSSGGSSILPSFLGGGGSSSGPAATPLDWVGETVEGSINWLRGNIKNGGDGGGGGGECGSAAGQQSSNGRGATGDGRRRRRSRSIEARREVSLGSASDPDGELGAFSSSGAASPTGAALPPLGEGIPHGEVAQQQPPARIRAWSRNFGLVGSGGQAAAAATAGDSRSIDPYDGDESVDDRGERGYGEESALLRGAARAGAEDWMVGAGLGDTSESGSVSSVTTGWRGRRSNAGESDTGGEGPNTLRWEVDGRRQNLRRSITAGAPTEDSQMVQDLLEMVSDAPVDHAGQWIPVRVRRGIHIWTSTVEGSPYCRIRGRMRCEATPAQLLQLLIDDERIVEYDRMFDRYEMVERPNDHTSVRWTSYRAIWPTRPRDFVIRSTWEEFADGTIVIATRSVEHEDYPETPTFVRGKMVTCGYVICPLGESRRQRRSSRSSTPATQPLAPTASAASTATAGDVVGGGSSAAAATAAAAGAGGSRSMELRPSSEFTMYAHTDLGGVLPASVINKLCKKPAYRVMRKIQSMIATDTLVKRGDDGNSTGAGGSWPLASRGGSRMSRQDSEDVLGSLLVEGMPDHAAAENLEDVPEGEMEVASGAETETMGRGRGPGDGGENTPEGSPEAPPARPGRSTPRQGSVPAAASRAPSPFLPGLSREYAISEAQRIMKTLNRMASDEGLGWSQVGVAAHSDMALYKSPVAGTKKVRLGASTCVSALPSELVGILQENAAMLGPDYIVDRQELLETFSSGVNTGEGLAEAAARADGEEPQHDTAIYWFSCTHKRQRICRDFVILRCFRPLPGCGGLIAYCSIDHPGLPPCPDYVRGKLDVSGFVILPNSPQEGSEEQQPQQQQQQHYSDVEHNRRSGPRSKSKKRQRWRGREKNSSVNDRNSPDGSLAASGAVTRRRSRSSASGIGNYLDSDEEEDGLGRGVVKTGRRGRRSRGGVAVEGVGDGGGGGGGVSEVTFFTHLTFSAFLPDFQEMEACRHFVGPLHILQELKWVVERTLGSFQEDEVLQDAAAKLGAGGGGADWGQVLSRRRMLRSSRSERRSSMTAEERRASGAAGGEADTEGDDTAGATADSGSLSEVDSIPPRDSAAMSNAVLLRVSTRREAMLRDMLAFSSDGECMDGPQVDWNIIKESDGLKLCRATVPGTVWCMIRTRAVVTAPPREVLTYLLNDSCIPDYDELFANIELVEPVDETSVFKRTSYKPIWPTAPRDFSLLSSWGMLEDGTAYVLNRSVDHPLNPPVQGHVRGVVMLCGFLMVPRPREAGGGCVITMIVHTDLGGNLPASILNRLSTHSPWRLVQRLRAAFESNGRGPTPAQRAAAQAVKGEPTAVAAAAGTAAAAAMAARSGGGGGGGGGVS